MHTACKGVEGCGCRGLQLHVEEGKYVALKALVGCK